MLLVENLALSFEESLRDNGIVAVHSKTTVGDPSLRFIFEHDELTAQQLNFLTYLLKYFRNVDGFYVDVSYSSEKTWKNERMKFGWKQII